MHLKFLIGSSIFLFLFAAVPAFALEDGDFQLWNTEVIEAKLNDSFKVKVEEELRFGEDVSILYYRHTDGGVTWKVTDGLDLGVNYRQLYEKKKNKWKEENRPHINGTVKREWLGFKFKDRNRFEYRIKKGGDDTTRYRNKATVLFPLKWTKLDIQPYVADEIFVDFEGEKLNRNRLYAGFNAKLFKHFKTDIFYLWQTTKKNSKWINYNILSLKLKLVL